MKELASASVSEAEASFKFPREKWELIESPGDDQRVIFYLEDIVGMSPPYLYHAMVDGEVAFYGNVSEIPKHFRLDRTEEYFSEE